MITKARANKLIRDANGNVEGCEYEKDGKIHKVYGPVVIATGGFGHDYESDSLFKKYGPQLLSLPTTNGDDCTGDGMKMSKAIGGDVVDMEYIQVHPTGLVDPKNRESKVKFLAAEALRGEGGLILNADGERFCDELGRRDYVTGEMNKNKGPFRLVLNGKAEKQIAWHCAHYVERGLMTKYNSGKELAQAMKIDPAKLAKTFEQYSKDAQAGKA